MIVPWFGPLPSWHKLWSENVPGTDADGYDVFVTHDEAMFADRVERILGVKFPGGGMKVCDYRCAFGVLFADELRGYDFWGHTDTDMVYGRIGHFMNDTRLAGLEQWSNHPTYVSGPWSVYKNTASVNELFMAEPDWRGYLSEPQTSGWVEQGYSKIVQQNLQHLWTDWQHQNLNDFASAHWDGPCLMDGDQETMMAHFRRTKTYPPQLVR